MTESFVKYNSDDQPLGSPSYFNSHFMNDLTESDLAQFDPSSIGHNGLGSNKIEEHYENRAFDALSNDSYSSTNHSSKYSPDFSESLDMQTGMSRKPEDGNKTSSTLVKKAIHKYYEAIVDNNVTYHYEDDPVEYKKARKRIQNRESASRVRSKKKGHVEDMEVEMNEIRKENSELKVQNAALRAENNLLKQQTCFLERMVMKTNYQPMGNPMQMQMQGQGPMNPNYEECLLPLVNNEKSNNKSSGYFRPAPAHTFKKHVAMLGVLTILVCTVGFVGKGEGDSVQGLYPAMGEFRNGGFAVKSVEGISGSMGNLQEFDKMLGALLKANEEYDSMKRMGWMALTTMYIIYLVYVLLITNWKYLFQMNKKLL